MLLLLINRGRLGRKCLGSLNGTVSGMILSVLSLAGLMGPVSNCGKAAGFRFAVWLNVLQASENGGICPAAITAQPIRNNTHTQQLYSIVSFPAVTR